MDRRLRGILAVQGTQSVMDTYNRAGGGLTAAGPAHGALFAVIPGLLLLASIAVIVVDSPEARQDLDWIVEQVLPLHDFAKQIVTGLANGARVGTLIGLVGFIWGASGFYLGLQGAMMRIFPARRAPDPIWSRVQGSSRSPSWWAPSSPRSWQGPPCRSCGPGGPAFSTSCCRSSRRSSRSRARHSWRSRSTSSCSTSAPAFRAVLPAAVLAGIVMGLLTSLFGLLVPCSSAAWPGWACWRRCSWRWSGSTGCSRLLLGASHARLRNDQRLPRARADYARCRGCD
ncbi:MAG: YhjD/YihY/BrkB family envelope integrity protein [Chloroflexota bacterium]